MKHEIDGRVDTTGNPSDSPTAASGGGVVSNGQHTPLPWVADANGLDVRTGGPGGLFVARTYAIPIEDNPNDAYRIEQRANAAFIVTAVNSHDDLLAALKVIADSEEECGCGHTTQSCCNKVGVFCTRCIAAAAIATIGR